MTHVFPSDTMAVARDEVRKNSRYLEFSDIVSCTLQGLTFSMTDSIVAVDVDAEWTARQAKSITEEQWNVHKSIRSAQLQIDAYSQTPIATFLSSKATKQTLSKLHNSKFWNKLPTTATLHALRQVPLIPIVLPVSKLLLALHPNYTHPLVLNSFTYIKIIQHAYMEAMTESSAPPKRKNAIEKQKSKVLSDMLTFTSNTLARLFVRSSESELLIEMFLRECYYTTINIIRIFEYSILDLLLLPEKNQSPLVTPLETDLEQWKSTSAFPADLVETFKPSFAESYKLAYSISIDEATNLVGEWPNETFKRQHLELCRRTVEDHLFYCGNHESCHNRETKVKMFARCAKCKWTRYCSQACQLNHWKIKHKSECLKPLLPADAEQLFKGRRIVIGAEGDAPKTEKPAPETAETTQQSLPTPTNAESS